LIKIANWYSVLHRNDGHPLYLTAFLKRAQYYLDVARGFEPSGELKAFFPDGKDDPRAKEFAEWFMFTFQERFKIYHMRPHNYRGEYGEFDLNFWVDWGEDSLKEVLGYEPDWPKSPVAYWVSDTHVGYDYRLELAKKSDVVFVFHKRGYEDFIRDGIKDPVWVLPCYDPMAYPKFNLAYKPYDVGFVGNINSQNRLDALDRMFGEFPNFYFGWKRRFEEAARKYAESKICFNIAWFDDINMRNFEVLGSGGFLLTNDIPSIHEVFEDGKHLVLYKDLDDAVEKARYYLKHEDERNRIAEAGYNHVLKNHTIFNRAKQIFEVIHDRNLIKKENRICQATQVS
jgi:hypothetical protein